MIKKLCVCGLTAVAVACLAQDSFPDSRANHWAYESVARLRKDGVLTGYPDGLFRGGRPASRYELAAVTHAAYISLKARTDRLSGQIDALKAKIDQGGPVTQADLSNLKSALAAAQNDLNGVKAYGQDLSDLKKLAQEFEKELTSMGVHVEAMKDDLSHLDARITSLEKRQLPIDISGDLSAVALGGYSGSGAFGITVDGRPTGVGRGSLAGNSLDTSSKVGASRDLTILQEAAVRMDSANGEGLKWSGTIVAGNMVGINPNSTLDSVAFGDQSSHFSGAPFADGPTSLYVQDLSISFDTSLAGIPFNTEVGRVGYAINPYIFQRPDNSPYFDNARWDSGAWNFDGAIVTLDYGSTKFRMFGGRSNLNAGGVVSSGALQPMQAGAAAGPFTLGSDRPRGATPGLLTVDQSLGANLNIPVTQAGVLNLAYLWLSSDTSSPVNSASANGVRVVGGDLKLNHDNVGIEGGYSKSDLVSNNKVILQRDNDAYWVSINKDWKQAGAKAGYRYIAPQFGAPGDWGRIGIWWNPTDIKGFTTDVHYDINQALRLSAGGEFYTGAGSPSSTLSTDDKIQRYQVGLTFERPKYDVSLSYEEAHWDLADRVSLGFSGGQPTERWYNLGFGVHLSDSARLKLLWQVSDYDSAGVHGFAPFSNSSANVAKGGLITTQISVKF